jgi:Type III flagellar switch regulator (C-ring) FliN C-term
VSRLLTPEELKALRAMDPYIPAPTERFHIVVDAGHTDLSLEEVAALVPGSVIPLDRKAGQPVEIVANAVTVAFGKLVEVRGRVAVRVLSVGPQAISVGPQSTHQPHPTPETKAKHRTQAKPGRPAKPRRGKS